MKLLQPLKVEFIGVKENEFTTKDNKVVKAYKVQFDYGGEIEVLKCTKDVFDKGQNIERFTDVMLTTEYSDDYGKPNYRVIDIL